MRAPLGSSLAAAPRARESGGSSSLPIFLASRASGAIAGEMALLVKRTRGSAALNARERHNAELSGARVLHRKAERRRSPADIRRVHRLGARGNRTEFARQLGTHAISQR